MPDLHDDHLPITTDLVRRLVERSFPEHAGLTITPLNVSGSTNALYRLGDDFLVRLPRQPGGSASIDKEARWLPFVAPHLTVPVPEVVGVGDPAHGYPERWSVTRWLDGRTPTVPWDPADGSPAALAEDLARTVRELRAIPVPADVADDPDLQWYRGGLLRDVDAEFREALAGCREIPELGLDLGRALEVWEEALAVELRWLRGSSQSSSAPQPASGAPQPAWCWFHGDLFAENLLVRDGRLAAVLDAGGLAIGDPTIDLVAGFEVLDAAGLRIYRNALEVSDDEWTRAKGWALFVAIVTFPYYWETMPTRCAHRRVMAQAVLTEPRLP